MGKKTIIIDAAIPEGGLSTDLTNKINEVYITRFLEDQGAGDLASILASYNMGKILEFAGQLKGAKKLFQNILKKNPTNRWAKEALRQIEISLN